MPELGGAVQKPEIKCDECGAAESVDGHIVHNEPCRRTMSRAEDLPSNVNHPRHYNASSAACLGCGRSIECIDVIESFPLNVGSAMKYLWRAGLKTEDPTEDFEKAIWYVRREIERRKKASRPAAMASASVDAAPSALLTEVVAGAIIREGTILLCQRLPNVDFPLLWECPGGKVERGETHHQALKRELREELGIDTREISSKPIWSGEFKNKVSRPDRSHISYDLYLVNSFAGIATPLQSQSLSWFSETTLRELVLSESRGAPGLRASFQEITQQLRLSYEERRR